MDDREEAFTVQQAGDYVGVSRRTIYNYIDAKLLPVHRTMSGKPLFLKPDLDKLRQFPPKRGRK